MKKILMVIATITVLSCNKRNDSSIQDMTIAEVEFNKDDQHQTSDEGLATDSTPMRQSQPPQIAVPKTDWTKKIIKTANVRLELNDYNLFNNTVHNVLQNYGAYIAQEQQLQSDGQISNQLSIKVPVDQFEQLMNYLTSERKNKVLQKEITSSDVTAEFVDTRSRIETKKQLRAKYYDLLKEAKKMDDVLQVHSEINSITEEIEAASGRMEYISHQSVYSTINLQYFQILDASKVNDNTPGFFNKFTEALKGGTSLIGNIVIAVAYLWPLIILGLALFLIIKRSRLFSRMSQTNNELKYKNSR